MTNSRTRVAACAFSINVRRDRDARVAAATRLGTATLLRGTPACARGALLRLPPDHGAPLFLPEGYRLLTVWMMVLPTAPTTAASLPPYRAAYTYYISTTIPFYPREEERLLLGGRRATRSSGDGGLGLPCRY